jgi:predicted ATPase
MTTRLNRIRVAGFRSLRDVSLELTPFTVLIGPNGAGKSNLLAVFAMLERCAAGFLPLHVTLHGGASYLMHRSKKEERRIAIEVEFSDGEDRWGYSIVLRPTVSDALAFETELVGYAAGRGDWNWTELTQGNTEGQLAKRDNGPIAQRVRELLLAICSYHFHDTSRVSELRSNARQADDRRLLEHGGNLAALWLRWKASTDVREQFVASTIESALRMVVPGIATLEPTALPGDAARLDWIDDQGERLHMAHLSDGTLRFIALLTALGQPTPMRPKIIVIDEPELGLHPAALDLLGEWMHSAAVDTQIVVSTQSPKLLCGTVPEDVVIVEREAGATALRRKSSTELSGWLSDSPTRSR